jgi:hypothetical protein
MLLIFIDAGAVTFTVEEKWTDLLQLVLITVIGAYFGGRSVEKFKKKVRLLVKEPKVKVLLGIIKNIILLVKVYQLKVLQQQSLGEL